MAFPALDKGRVFFELRKDDIMKNFICGIRILSCLAIFSVVFTLSCRKSTGPEETDVNQVDPQAAVQMPADSVAVTVNGVEINESDINELIQPQLDIIAERASQIPPDLVEQNKKQLRGQALEKLIVEHLLDEKVKEANIEVTEEEVIKLITETLSTQPEPLSLEEYKKKLVENGRSFEEEKERIREGLAYQRILEAQMAGKINVTEDDAKKIYDENPKQFESPEQIRASHILIIPELIKGGDPNEAKATAKAKAQDLLKQIKDGADLAELAKSNSACPSASKGGDLNFFSRGDMMPSFEKAAFELEVGQISDIVETKYGYHIIKVTDHKDAGIISFEEAKDKIIGQLTQSKQLELTKEYIESLKAEANIVYPSGDQM